MKILEIFGLVCVLCCLVSPERTRAFGQEQGGTSVNRNVAVVKPGETMDEVIRKAANVAPTPQQLAWQKREFIAFTHFGMDTFTDREWGLGTESPVLFNPTTFDARQWARAIKDAGMKMVILTAKHHDGFCLWPSKYTEHSVKNSPWRGGKGDVVKEVSAACKEFGLKFGIYLSPWDRHEKTYGDSPKYNEYFRNQLRELLSNYGEVSEVWFDGANGEGPNGKNQVYDWPSYYKVIRELQPEAVIFGMGPDVRWVGTESGYGRETEWSVLPDIVQNLDAIAASSQQHPVDGAFVPGDMTNEDLGSRDKIKNARALVWYPAETDVSIRPGWFYHQAQDGQVKTPEKLVDIYYNSVGKNSVLLLNIPPDKRGLIHQSDIKSLSGMRKILDQTFRKNLLVGATASASSAQSGHEAFLAIDNDPGTYWMSPEGTSSATLEFTLSLPQLFDRAMFQEFIQVGQRVESFHLDAWNGNSWVEVAKGTTIGYKRLLRFPPVSAGKVRLVIEQSRTNPTISSMGLFKAPPQVTIEPPGGTFEDSLEVRLSSDVGNVTIHYTLDGTEPGMHSPVYSKPFILTLPTLVKAKATMENDVTVEYAEARYIRGKKIRAIAFGTHWSPKYSAQGDGTIIDGKRGLPGVLEKGWLGFEGNDMEVRLDLGASEPITKVTAGFLQNQSSWIFLPTKVTFSVSNDGSRWRTLPALTNPVVQNDRNLVKDFEHDAHGMKARFVRVQATNIGMCPSWHPGAGKKAWIFVDEIVVE